MFPPESRHGADAPSLILPAISGILLGLPAVPTYESRGARRLRFNSFLGAAEVLRVAAPKQERFHFGGCLLIFWLIGAASLSGYVILALFIMVALARLAKNTCVLFAEKLPRRSRCRIHLIAWASAAFFSLLTVRACYIAAVIVDTRFR